MFMFCHERDITLSYCDSLLLPRTIRFTVTTLRYNVITLQYCIGKQASFRANR